ncbi:MAG: TolC family protein [Gemmatimonadaceae bacterium]|nr:TolC family protein [Gemmatimonadaceae bacterium]
MIRLCGGRPALVAVATAILAFVGMGVPRSAPAQQEDSTATRRSIQRLEDAYALLEASPRIRAARSAAQAALAVAPTAGTLDDPQVQLGLMNRQLPGLAPMSPLGMTQLQVMQMLPLTRRLRLARGAADATASAAAANAAAVEWSERLRVSEAFHDVWRLEQSMEIVAETKQVMEQLLTVARAMYEVGDGRQADVLRARVQVEQMDEELQRLASARVTAVARLNGLLDRPAGAAVGRTVVASRGRTIPPLDSVADLADRRRPELVAGAALVESANSALAATRLELWPDLQVGVAVGQRREGGATERMGSLMLGASLPVFAARRQLAWRTEREAMLAMAQADLQAMRATTRAEIEGALAELHKSQRLLALYDTSILPQAAATVESSLLAYRAGDLPFMSLAESQVALNEFRLEYVALQADEGRLWATLEALVAAALPAPGEGE